MQSCKLWFGSGEVTVLARFLLHYSVFAAVEKQFAMMAASAVGLLWNSLLILVLLLINFVSGTSKGTAFRF